MRPHAGSTANASGVIPVSQSHAFHPAPDDSGNNLHTRSDFLPRALNAKEQILSTKLLDAQDALDLIAVAGSKDGASEASLSLERTQPAPTHQYTLDSPAPTPIASSWKHFFLVRRGIIRANEATEYFDFYFSYLWHVFPVVPQWYSSPDRYGSLVAEEPVLAMGLIMTASRYHPLSGLNGHARSERIHWRTWPWFQRVLQSSMWGSPVMRKLGSVAALLLLIEWHPRAINSPEDLVGDCSEIELFDPQGQPYEADTRESTEHDQLPESSSIPERLNIIAPAYRSNKMSRMLLSTAIALAREIGCFDNEQVLAQPRSAGAALKNSAIGLEWSRILYTFLCLTDEALALRLRLEPQLASTNWTEMVYSLPPSLMGDGFLESAVDLTINMRKARELLLAWRKSEHCGGSPLSAAAWDSFRQGLDCWERQHYSSRSGKPTDLSLRAACLHIEYYYVRLCGLSPAAYMLEKSSERHANADPHVTSLSQVAEAATKAAIDMLELITDYFTSSLLFKHAAVRYWLYILCASREEPLDRTTNPCIDLLLRTINVIRQNAPDDIHMSQRYADLLEIFVNAVLRPSAMANNTTPGGNQIEVIGSRLSPNRAESELVESSPLKLGYDWIYDSNFWDTLPEMVGLDSLSDLVLPYFE
ncbi:conserved hypothetical protein [Aspergillus fumigatus A1163]|uniref:Transcription factor domain-containing protein n=1 Tax=Aspergillus fumigatus (strain CBS 144.89 / FGSC A1163 / CEA10) TaxID=451804 RepID=B0XPC9_ASPFC|nr:conserved hypothetical protein [Aspergillus fumigatus A1163]